MSGPFKNDEENKKFEVLFNSFQNSIDEMILSNDPDIKKYLEVFISGLLLEINKKFPEPNYSIYVTYRIKSQRSDIAKLADYLRRAKDPSSVKQICVLLLRNYLII